MWFASDPGSQSNMIPLSVNRVREIIRANQKGIKVAQLSTDATSQDTEPTFADVVGEESLTRFDKQQSRRKNRKKKKASAANTSAPTRDESQERKADSNTQEDRSNKERNKAVQNTANDVSVKNGGNEVRKEGAPRKNNKKRKRNNPNGGQPRQEGEKQESTSE